MALTPFLILHAFASGTTALTGVEAISNGITAFREPRSRNAGITLIWMSVILGTLLLGITFLARAHRRRSLGARRSSRSWPAPSSAGATLSIWLTIAATTLILIMAANTVVRRLPPAGARCTPATASCPGSSPTAAAGWSSRAASWPWR